MSGGTKNADSLRAKDGQDHRVFCSLPRLTSRERRGAFSTKAGPESAAQQAWVRLCAELSPRANGLADLAHRLKMRHVSLTIRQSWEAGQRTERRHLVYARADRLVVPPLCAHTTPCGPLAANIGPERPAPHLAHDPSGSGTDDIAWCALRARNGHRHCRWLQAAHGAHTFVQLHVLVV